MRPAGWITIAEAALVVQRTHWAVRKWIDRGRLEAVKTDTGTIYVDPRAALDVDRTLYLRDTAKVSNP